jgi:ABC-type lipoprotein release transport system permease subunit
MNIFEPFYRSAIVNALIFLWLASAVSSVRILIRCEKKVSIASLFGLIFGPLAFFISWLYETRFFKRRDILNKPRISKQNNRSLLGIVLIATAIISAFYILFVRNYYASTMSNEILLRNIFIFVVVAGFFSGILLSLFTRRVSFLEACWTVFIFSFFALSIHEFANEAFPYGTSSAYFMTLLLSATMLLLIFLTIGGSLGYLICGEGRFNMRFGYEHFIGTRFLMSKRSSQVVSLITVISIIAIMIACGGMILVMSVMNGFSSDLRSKILGANAHLMVLKYGNDFNEYRDIIEKTKNISGITGASAFIVNEGMVSAKKNLSGAIITGIDAKGAKDSGRLKYIDEKSLENLLQQQNIPVVENFSNYDIALSQESKKSPPINQLPGVIIGKEMAVELQVFVGDIVNLISPVGDIGPTGPIPKAKPFRVAGLFYSGMYEFDSKFAYITLKEAQDFFNLKDAVTGIEYSVLDIEKTRGIAKEIVAAIGGYPFHTRDWMQMNRNMFSALQLEKIAMLIILGTLVFMASLLILVTLIMVVMEKGKEIAILKSMGSTDVSIMKIFVTYGLSVGGLGSILGGSLGLFLCLLIEKVGIRLDPDVYYFSNLPVKIVTNEVLLVVFSAILISFLATIPPSLFAARLKPVEGLRYE